MTNVVTDGFDDIAGGLALALSRPGYQMSGRFYKCQLVNDCGDNNNVGFTGKYIWNYQQQTLTFDTAVMGVGFEFGFRDNQGLGGTTTAVIGGVTGPTASTSTFFGVISDTAFSSIDYNLTSGSLSLIDNLTYGTAASVAVPLPASAFLLFGALGGIAVMRRRNKA